MKKNVVTTFLKAETSTRPQQVDIFSIRRRLVSFARAQDKRPQFWQTRSHAIIAHSSVPADCIHKVISQKGERILFERLSTPRPCTEGGTEECLAIAAAAARHIGECCFGHQEIGAKRGQGNPTEIPELPSSRKLERNTESLVEKDRRA